MTMKMKLESNPRYLRIKTNLEKGTIGIMDAAKAVTDDYYKGYFAFVEAEAAIKLLAKVKVK